MATHRIAPPPKRVHLIARAATDQEIALRYHAIELRALARNDCDGVPEMTDHATAALQKAADVLDELAESCAPDSVAFPMRRY